MVYWGTTGIPYLEIVACQVPEIEEEKKNNQPCLVISAFEENIKLKYKQNFKVQVF